MTAVLASGWWELAILGVAAGLLSGALGIGSGTLLVPAMVIFFGFAQRSAQGTALAVMVPMALVGAARYATNAEAKVDLAFAALIAAGAVAGALAGAELAQHLPDGVLRRIFALYLVLVAVKMLWPSS